MKSCYRVPWLYVILAALLVLFILAYFFQWAALLSILPWLIILACPLMHFFHGHEGHGHSHKNGDK